MTDDDRRALRELQDRWLAHPLVRRQIERHGEDDPIGAGGGWAWPTFRDVRTMVLPDWEAWFADFLRGD